MRPYVLQTAGVAFSTADAAAVRLLEREAPTSKSGGSMSRSYPLIVDFDVHHSFDEFY